MSEQSRKKRQKAAALGYERSVDAPSRVMTSTTAETAQSIVACAEAHGIPVERDPDLLQCLAPMASGDVVSPAAYTAVAEILAFLYRENSGH